MEPLARSARDVLARHEDDSSEKMGNKQAGTFESLAELAGKRTVEEHTKKSATSKAKSGNKVSSVRSRGEVTTRVTSENKDGATYSKQTSNLASGSGAHDDNNLNITVRIEINLPVADDQAVYDRIFKSMRANLLQRMQE